MIENSGKSLWVQKIYNQFEYVCLHMGRNNPYYFPNSTPEEIFIQAEAFRNASGVTKSGALKYSLQGNPNFGLSITFAACINEAFACELYFKCISVIEKGKYMKGHNLLDLFNDLSQKSRDELIKRHDVDVIHGPITFMINRNGPKTLIQLLTEAQDYFPNMRYLFEGNKYTEYGLDFAVRLVRSYIIKLRPDFELFVQTQEPGTGTSV